MPQLKLWKNCCEKAFKWCHFDHSFLLLLFSKKWLYSNSTIPIFLFHRPCYANFQHLATLYLLTNVDQATNYKYFKWRIFCTLFELNYRFLFKLPLFQSSSVLLTWNSSRWNFSLNIFVSKSSSTLLFSISLVDIIFENQNHSRNTQTQNLYISTLEIIDLTHICILYQVSLITLTVFLYVISFPSGTAVSPLYFT